MLFNIGTAVTLLDDDDILVAAVSYFNNNPDFSTYGMSLPYMRDHFCSVTFIRQENITKAVNTAVNRSLEKLLIKELIIPEKEPQIALLVKPALKHLSFIIPHTPTQKHWLLTAAHRAAALWLQGE